MALLTVVALWSSTFVVTKGLFDQVSPLAFTAVRFVLIAALAVGVPLFRHRGRLLRVQPGDLRRIAIAGLVGYTCYQLGFVLGLDRTSAFSNSLLIAMVPLFTTIILAASGEPPPRGAWVGLGIAVIGVTMFLVEKRGSGSDGSLLGDAFSLAAGVSFAVYGLVARPLVRDYSMESYTAYTVIAGTIPLLLISAPAAVAQDWGAVSTRGWVGIVYMAIFPVYVAYQLWNWAISRRGAVAATAYSLLVPIASGVLSAVIFDERFGPAKLLGAALVLAGLFTMRWGRTR